ncbi:MAG: hypothetical protein F9K46_09360 [Anaerolineae bacterium]|nr:MAG: hypothetical protein F9K46_09360 [Anaerolineae bacterium]
MSDELNTKVAELRTKLESLQDLVAMDDVTRQLGDLATTITGLPAKVKQLRDKGYLYANFLEQKTTTLDEQWAAVRGSVSQSIQDELQRAQDQIEEIDDLWGKLDAALAQGGQPAPTRTGAGSLGAKMQTAIQSAQKAGAGAKIAGAVKPSGAGGALSQMAQPPKPAGGGLVKGAMSGAATGTKPDALISQLDGAMSRLSSEVDGAKRRIEGMYGEIPNNVSQTVSQIYLIETYLERAGEASFPLLAGEAIYMVVEAEWKKGKDKDDNPDGLLYITNQRVVMEQKEKVGKKLGMFGGKAVQGLVWESPVGAITDVTFEKKGMFGGIDLVTLKFGSGGPFGETTLEVKDGLHAKWFAGKLKQAASGEIDAERVGEHKTLTMEAVADAPTMCPSCGATFTEPIVRGMTQITCIYCGTVVRLG